MRFDWDPDPIFKFGPYPDRYKFGYIFRSDKRFKFSPPLATFKCYSLWPGTCLSFKITTCRPQPSSFFMLNYLTVVGSGRIWILEQMFWFGSGCGKMIRIQDPYPPHCQCMHVVFKKGLNICTAFLECLWSGVQVSLESTRAGRWQRAPRPRGAHPLVHTKRSRLPCRTGTMNQCFGSGFRDILLDPVPDSPNPDPGAQKRSKMLTQHKIILLFTILPISLNWLLLTIKWYDFELITYYFQIVLKK